jgi:hypothetical protein
VDFPVRVLVTPDLLWPDSAPGVPPAAALRAVSALSPPVLPEVPVPVCPEVVVPLRIPALVSRVPALVSREPAIVVSLVAVVSVVAAPVPVPDIVVSEPVPYAPPLWAAPVSELVPAAPLLLFPLFPLQPARTAAQRDPTIHGVALILCPSGVSPNVLA